MPTPSLSAGYLIAVVSAIVSLAATQSLIDDRTAQLVTGLASILIPSILALGHSIFHGHVQAAKVAHPARKGPRPVPDPPKEVA